MQSLVNMSLELSKDLKLLKLSQKVELNSLGFLSNSVCL